jgi:hypothetical protein
VPGELLRAPSPPAGSGQEEAGAWCCGLFRLDFEAASERPKASLTTARLSAYSEASLSRCRERGGRRFVVHGVRRRGLPLLKRHFACHRAGGDAVEDATELPATPLALLPRNGAC